jgi:hypothetical protein
MNIPNEPNAFAGDETMQRLLRLKRYEQPPEGYYEDFLSEFHHRQRAELLRPSLTTLLLERFASWAAEFRVPAIAYAGATALAVVASIGILQVNPAAPTGAPAAYAVSYSQTPFSQTPVTIQKMQPVSLRVNTQAEGDSTRLLPTAYLLQGRSANHESPLSF